MTTIVVDAKRMMMVSDSRWANDHVKLPCNKIERLNGKLYGFAGDDADSQKMIGWFKRNGAGKKPRTKEGFECLVLHPDGSIHIWSDNNDVACRIERSFHAIGSGDKAALGALYAGRTAEESVEIACQIDANSEGPIRIELLNPLTEQV